MNIQKDVDKIRQAMKLLWEASIDTHTNIDCQTIVVDPDAKDQDWFCPFVVTTAQDWKFKFDEDDGFTLNYQPIRLHHETEWDKFENDIDPERLVTFKEPPKEKCPATGQSKQGKSIDEIAHKHLTISEEGFQ